MDAKPKLIVIFILFWCVFQIKTATLITKELPVVFDEVVEENTSDTSGFHNLIKRFTNFMNPPNKSYQPCVTPTGSAGHCKHIQHCVLSEFQNDFWKVFDYLCIIERSAVGVCCPDDLTHTQGAQIGPRLPAMGEDMDLIGEESGRIVNNESRGCGLATKQQTRITGGRPADPKEWPWMAAVLHRRRPKTHCGGSLITDRHVLSAAHCLHQQSMQDIFVRLGEYDFRASNETRSRDFRVTEINSHVDFDPSTYENDIAILKLDRPTIFNTYIWPVCLPPLGEQWEGWNGVVTGWGTQFFGGPYSDVLMEVSVPIWEQKKCQEMFVERIGDSFICAGDEEGGRDSCQGDSGGPLLVQIPNKRWVVVGVVSWGVRCGEMNNPGIYTRVSSFLSWIVENSVF